MSDNNSVRRLHPLNSALFPPEKLNDPFDYVPHPLAVQAACGVRDYLEGEPGLKAEADLGKMFGVLVVEVPEEVPLEDAHPLSPSSDGAGCLSGTSVPAPVTPFAGRRRLGYLAAYSGLLRGSNDLPFFVPAVFDILEPDGWFKTCERGITSLSSEIAGLQSSSEYARLRSDLQSCGKAAEEEILSFKSEMASAKIRRDALRSEGVEEAVLVRESQFQKAELRRLKKKWEGIVALASGRVEAFRSRIESLKAERQKKSDELQKWLFKSFRPLNARGETKDLEEIFIDYAEEQGSPSPLRRVPPAGTGECCAPKLLHHAFSQGLKPLCIAEFWWGRSPVGEIRRHLQFYPACQGKCRPVLRFMLQGLEVDPPKGRRECPEPFAKHCDVGGPAPSIAKTSLASAIKENVVERSASRTPSNPSGTALTGLEIIFDDPHLAVVSKPAKMLSVPGKGSGESVYSIVRQMFPFAVGPLLAHRLDFDTSGLLLVAKSKEAHQALQRQFEAREVAKKYIALVRSDGSLSPGMRGKIELPISPDYLDRPKQVVDFQNGKPACTEYFVLSLESMGEGRGESPVARLELRPLTGRTHQLRVHCAHSLGLGCPILGDPLYGDRLLVGDSTPAATGGLVSVVEGNPRRMCLHAAELSFRHPVTGQRLTFRTDPDF